MTAVDVEYFRSLLRTETEKLQSLSEKWSAIKEKEPLSEEVLGQINSTKGQALLLISQRFKQFNGLINDCENNTGLKEITALDLQGFWDMIYFQVEDVKNKFKKLEELKQNEWQETNDVQKKNEKNKESKKIVKTGNNMKTVRSSSGLRDHIMKARSKIAKSTSAGELGTIHGETDSDSAFSSNDSVYSSKCHFELGTNDEKVTKTLH